MGQNYTDINAETIDRWAEAGWEWAVPINHDTYLRALRGDWSMVLTPTKPVPRAWFGDLAGRDVLGLAAGGGQQMPIFAAAGARCTVLDYSEKQLQSEREVAAREGYAIDVIRADMTRPLPFPDNSFDLIFHPVSNCYVEDIEPIWRECCRVLRPGGALLAGFGNELIYAFDDDERELVQRLPYNPLRDKALYRAGLESDSGVQFSHTIEEQIGGQLRAGLVLTDIYGDTSGRGGLHDLNVPTFTATRSVKP